MSQQKLNIKKVLTAVLWVFIGAGGIVLLVAAVRSNNVKACKGIDIEITGVSNNFFIDKEDVLLIVKNFAGGEIEGRPISSFNLGAIEANLEKDVWIKNAELFFDNNQFLRVSIDEREPVARVFSLSGKSFYIDSSVRVLPLSEKFSARLPVFTGFAHNPDFISRADSNLLVDIMKLSMLLQADSFLMAMIEQVDITPQRNFEMLPKIGNQLIVFGDAADAAEKFNKLRLFYRSVMTKAGWNKYSVINLQYKQQVVAKIRDAEDKTSDSLRALQIMQVIAERSARQASDSLQFFARETERFTVDSSMIQQSFQREDEGEEGSAPAILPPATVVKPAAAPVKVAPVVVKPSPVKVAPVLVKPPALKKAVTKKAAIAKSKPAVKPAALKKPASPKSPQQKPKAVMQRR